EVYHLSGNFHFVLIGILAFLGIESLVQWHHDHHGACKDHHKKGVKSFAFINVIGDGVHNFLDGVLIAAAFMLNTATGVAASIAIALHEIPQEIGDFAILRHAGLSTKKA